MKNNIKYWFLSSLLLINLSIFTIERIQETNNKWLETENAEDQLNKEAQAIRKSILNNSIFKPASENPFDYDYFITRLANLYAQGNKAKAAVALATEGAGKWLEKNFETEKDNLVEIFFDSICSSLCFEKNKYVGWDKAKINTFCFILDSVPSIVNTQNDEGESVLMLASAFGYEEIVKKLINAGANLNLQNVNGNNALVYIMGNPPQIKIAQILIDSGIDINVRNKDDYTPLMVSVIFGGLDIAHLLLENGATLDLDDLNKLPQNELVGPIICYAYNKTKLKQLIDMGVNINAQCLPYKYTALMIAASIGDPQMIQNLIDLGANIHSKDCTGKNALMAAIEKNNDKAIDQLVKAGAIISNNDNEEEDDDNDDDKN